MICSVTQTLPATQRRSPAYCNKIDLLHSFICSRTETFGYTEKTTRQMYFKAGGVTKKTVIVPFQDVPGDYFLGRQQLFDLTYVPLSVVLAGDLAQETLR